MTYTQTLTGITFVIVVGRERFYYRNILPTHFSEFNNLSRHNILREETLVPVTFRTKIEI
jgi:hypothetical protein